MPSNTIEDYKDKNNYYSSLSDTHYAMIIRDGVYYQRRWQVGLNGVETNVEEMKVDYVLGSGDEARSYLHRTSRDTLIELPLGWYSERGGYWALSPGFDSKHPQTRRSVSYECTFCHTGYPQLSAQTMSQTVDPVFTGKLAEGIDCQRCHGPGGQHVRVAESPNPTLAEFKKTIVNPAKLEPKRQLEVCMQCHLEPTSGHLPSIIRKFDRDPYSYIPGQPLEDFTRYFDYPEGKGYDDRFQIVSAAYRLRKSRCFLESNDKMTCLNCHDPHRVLPAGQEAVKFYASACRKCHEPALAEKVSAGKHTASVKCVSCHMAKRRTEDVVHVIITDHLIQRKPPNRNLLAELTELHVPEDAEYHGEVIPYYPAQPTPTSENTLYRSVAQVLLQNNLAKGVEELSRQMAQNPPLHPEFYTTLGDAWANTGEMKKSADAYGQALHLDGDSLVALSGLARVQLKQGDVARARETLDRALHKAPLDPNILYQYGLLEAQSGKREEALVQLQKALEINPDLPEGYFNLANLLVQTGKAQEAEPLLARALIVDPYDAAAYDLSGQVRAMKQDTVAALYNFQKAVHLRPGYPPYLYDHALALVQAGQYDEAKTQVQAAIQADPSYAEAREVLGALYVREKRPELAISEYRQAIAIRPGMMRVHLNLGLLLYSQGNRTEAIEHLRIAATDSNPVVAGQASQALQRLGVQ
ncbi:MAG: Tetratricopeptide 2 repeat protein [Acidobacteriaceae bacterium]|nr:Tetratricopeptide 2 repeat protein [Acidobacteriaceae bacterium]